MADDDFQLPAASLQLDPATLEIIEASKVKQFIGPLIVKAHEKKVRKIAVVAWEGEESLRLAAQILTVALSHQLDRKCALVIVEGIRFNCESFDSFSRVTLPEVENPALTEKAEQFIESMDRNFPFHVLVGPPIRSWSEQRPAKAKMTLNADAQILLVPEGGYPRGVVAEIEAFSRTNGLKWLGAIAIPMGAMS